MDAPTSPSPKQRFLEAYEREHVITRRVLDAFPAAKSELRPHPRLKSARELAWVFTLERGLGTVVMKDGLASGKAPREMPPAPDKWNDVLDALEHAHRRFADLIEAMSEEEFQQPVQFMTAPGRFEPLPRARVAWFLLHDQIHHRGQFSVYLRLADARVPSIYGPSADEPWM